MVIKRLFYNPIAGIDCLCTNPFSPLVCSTKGGLKLYLFSPLALGLVYVFWGGSGGGGHGCHVERRSMDIPWNIIYNKGVCVCVRVYVYMCVCAHPHVCSILYEQGFHLELKTEFKFEEKIFQLKHPTANISSSGARLLLCRCLHVRYWSERWSLFCIVCTTHSCNRNPIVI